MKNLFVLAFALFALVSCKSKDVDPIHAGEALSGTYTVTSILYSRGDSTLMDFPTMPFTDAANKIISGKLDVTRLEAMNQVNLKLTLEETGQEHPKLAPTNIENVEVRTDGGEYELHLGSLQLGTADTDGKLIEFDVTTTSTRTGELVTLRFRAER